MGCFRRQRCCCGCCLVSTGTKMLASVFLFADVLAFVVCIALLIADPTQMHGLISPAVSVGINVLICASLLHGALSRKPLFLRPWLALSGAALAVAAVALPVYSVVLVVDAANGVGQLDVGAAIGVIVAMFAGFALHCYIFSVIFSYHQELREEQHDMMIHMLSNQVENAYAAEPPPPYPNKT